MRIPRLTAIALLAVVPAFVAGAQERRAPANESREPRTGTDSGISIPRNMMPPAGKCRIWMKGVPAAQQPAPTDCTTALRQAPANGVLVFGPALRDRSPFDGRDPFVESNAPTRRNGRAEEVRRNREAERVNALSPATTGTQPVVPRREAAARAAPAPTTRALPTARQAPPAETRRPDPPPQSKKPEKP
ncbi:MAG: hypothetical protein ACYC0B_00460 [Gemmatimonadaceae bacterium]